MATLGRYLCGNKGTECPSNIIVFDTERLRVPVSRNGLKSESFLSRWHAIRWRFEKGKQTRRCEASGDKEHQFWAFLDEHSDKQRTTWIFSQDIGHSLTLLEFWSRLDEGIFSLNRQRPSADDSCRSESAPNQHRLSVDGIPTYIVVRSGQRLYKFVDTRNYWPKGIFGEYAANRLAGNATNPVSHNQDVQPTACSLRSGILEQRTVALIKGWRDGKSGVFQLTAAAMAMNNFRHTCDIRVPGKDKLDIVCKPNAREHDLERAAYFGGRTTCYRIGNSGCRIYHLDVNSLFPFVMREHAFPRRFIRFQPTATIDELRAMLTVYGVVANVLIDSPQETYPVRKDGKQYHATGCYWTALCGPELARAIRSESIARIGTVQVYSVARLFATWVSRWHDRKIKFATDGMGDVHASSFAKMILNSLYGKWAQRSKHWKDRPDRIPPERWGSWPQFDADKGEYSNWRAIAGNAQCQMPTGEPSHSFPLISAYIAAYAREYMGECIDSLPYGSVRYLAVDALFVTHEAYIELNRRSMIHPTEIGLFKVKEVYENFTLHGPNHYDHDGITTSSGIYGKYISDNGCNGMVSLDAGLPEILSKLPTNSVASRYVHATTGHADHRGNIDRFGRWTPIHYNPMRPSTLQPADFAFRPECFSDNPEGRTQLASVPSPLPSVVSLPLSPIA